MNLERALLADSLSRWSVLEHRVGLEDLRKLSTPLDWVFGGKDRKFLDVMDRLKLQKW